MSMQIVKVPPERWPEYMAVAELVFGETITPEATERWRKLSDLDRFITSMDERDRMVATAGVMTMTLRVPGADMAAGGVTFVTVLPSHRRRGLLRSMMRWMIDDVHGRGEPVAMLWASEGSIYQRFGYGLATYAVNLEAETRLSAYTRDWPREGSFRFLTQEEAAAVIAPIYDVARTQRAGFLSRTPDWWTTIAQDDDKKKGAEAKRIVVYETPAGPEAYAIYRTKGDWDVRGSTSTLNVNEAIGITPRGTREIWRYLLDVDLMVRVKAWQLPQDHPLLMLVSQPRRLGMTMGDGLWLRIVDAKAALEGRTYGLDGAATGTLTLDLRDEFCPWNAGRWRMEVAAGRATVSRTDGDADLALDANDLASLFLGGFTATGLSRAGRVVELRPGALGIGDGLFPTALQPWCPQEF
jgi:predicted acetyltransferase